MPRVIGTVFGLKDVYTQQILNTTRSADNYWPAEADYGIWVGNINAAAAAGSDIHRMDFASDTVIDLGNNPIAAARQGSAASCKQRFGWFIGGWTSASGSTSQIQRVDLTSDVFSIPKNWPASRGHIGGVSGEAYAYGAGGGTGGLGYSNTHKFDYSTETITSTTNMPASRVLLQTSSNKDYGFFTGGSSAFAVSSTKYSTTNKLDFLTDTYSASTNYPTNLMYEGASATTEHFAFMLGGGGATARSSTNRFNYTNETYSASTNLPQVARGRMSVGDRSFGYLRGGSGPGPTDITYVNHYSTVSKLNFTTETFSSSVNTTSGGGSGFASAGGGVPRVPKYDLSGYSLGGYTDTGDTSTILRNDYSTDTWAQTFNTITAAGSDMTGMSGNSNIYASGSYLSGTPGTRRSSIDRLDLNTEILHATPMKTNVAMRWSFGTENPTSYYGWNIGGSAGAGSYRSFVRRIDMTVDTTSDRSNWPLSIASSAMGSARPIATSFAFCGEPGAPAQTSYIRRFDWLTETTTAPGNFPAARWDLRCIQNNQYLWVTPGPYYGTRESRIWRWDWSAETATALSPVGRTIDFPNVTSSHYNGYISGGIFEPTGTVKFSFSSETPSTGTALPGFRGAAGNGQNIG